jgi:hypothetical protein
MNFDNMSFEEVAEYYKQRKPRYRRLLTRLSSFLKNFFGRSFSAFAAVIDVSGTTEEGNGNTLHVSGFKTPSATKLRGYIEALDVDDDLDELYRMYDKFQKSKLPEHKKLAATIKRDYDALLVNYNSALDAMIAVAKKTIPDNIGRLFEEAEKIVQKINPDAADDVETFISVGADPKDGVHFVQTIDVSHWDRTSKTKVLAIVVTAVLVADDNGDYSVRVYVTISDRAVLPFRYALGTEIVGSTIKAVSSKLREEIEHALAISDVLAVISPAPLENIDEVELTKMLEGISGVKGVIVFEDNIEVEIPTGSKDTIASVVQALNGYRPIKKLIRDDGFSPSFTEQGSGMYRYALAKGPRTRSTVETTHHVEHDDSDARAEADRKYTIDKAHIERKVRAEHSERENKIKEREAELNRRERELKEREANLGKK